jgi:hypothetical protein
MFSGPMRFTVIEATTAGISNAVNAWTASRLGTERVPRARGKPVTCAFRD